MAELRALILREWGILRRSALGGILLMFFGYAVLFLLCRTPDRYRLLADPMLLRKVALPGPMLLGLLFSYGSFAGEMRAGTWDTLRLLPCPRRTILAAKLLVGLGALGVATALPMLVLRQTLAALPATGGPVLTVGELLQHSLLGRALLLGLLSYLSGANAAFLARDGRGAFWAPLGVPVALLLSLSNDFRSESPLSLVLWATTALSALWLAHLLNESSQSGRNPSGFLLATRALLSLPIVLVALLSVGLIVSDIYLAPHDLRTNDEDESEPLFHGVDNSGHIVESRSNRGLLSMYRMEPLHRLAEPSDRYWTPALVGRHNQYFLHKDAHILLAYDLQSGLPLGCVGVSGVRDSGCDPFDSAPRAFWSSNGEALLITSTGVFALQEQDRTLLALHHGPISRKVNMSIGEDDGIAVQSGHDLLFFGEAPQAPDSADSADSAEAENAENAENAGSEGAAAAGAAEVASPPSTALALLASCRGVAVGADIENLAGRDGYIGLVVGGPGARHETLVVCRDGVVSEQRVFALTSRSDAENEEENERRYAAVHRVSLGVALLGPVVSEVVYRQKILWPGFGRLRSLSGARPAMWGAALVGALLLGGVMLLRRGARAAPFAVLFALLLGPAYALAYLLLRWRRPWIGGLGG